MTLSWCSKQHGAVLLVKLNQLPTEFQLNFSLLVNSVFDPVIGTSALYLNQGNFIDSVQHFISELYNGWGMPTLTENYLQYHKLNF